MSGSPRIPHTALVSRFTLAAIYGLGMAGLFYFSDGFWFLPAGWRLAFYWLTSRRVWPWLVASEFLALGWIASLRGTDVSFELILALSLPVAIYLGAISIIQRSPSHRDGDRAASLLIGAGMLASAANSVFVAFYETHTGSVFSTFAKAPFFALGDAVACLTLAPCLVALLGPRTRAAERRSVGWLIGVSPLPTLLYLASLDLFDSHSVTAAVVISGIAALCVALFGGWRAAALSGLLLSVALRVAEQQGWTSLVGFEMQLIAALIALAGLLLGEAADRLRLRLEALRQARDALLLATKRLVAAQEDERNRLGRELHDGLGQILSAARTRTQIIARLAHAGAPLASELPQLDGLLRSAQDDLYAAIDALQPVEIARHGFESALRSGPIASLLNDVGIKFETSIDIAAGLPDAMAGSLYRICQEAANNVAQAGSVRQFGVKVVSRCTAVAAIEVELQISDDGGPLTETLDQAGHGLQNIIDRATAMDAVYQFDPKDGLRRHWLRAAAPISNQSG